MNLRALIALAVSVMLTLSLSACHGESSNASTSAYTIGGAVTGLAAGTQIILDNNGGDALTVTANGAFTFAAPVAKNGSYAVTIGTQPTGQTCSVANYTGAGVTANISTVNVTCSTNTYTIGGAVTGLASSTQVILDNNGSDALTVATNGAFTFATPVASNGSYAVTVGTQPTGQICTATNYTGTGVTANISTVNITCSTDTYTIGGTVTGLANGTQVTLNNNGGDALTVTTNSTFTFATPVAYSGSYAVTVGTQPTGQTCSVANYTGAGVTANISTVNITCSTDTYTIGGTVTGLANGTQVTLDNNGGDALTVTTNGTFTFATPVTYNGSYAVTVGTQPTGQTCTVSNGSNTGIVANVTSVSIGCAAQSEYAYVANVNASTVSEYTIGTGGALTPMTPATVTTGTSPVSVTVDPTGKYAYVANLGNATVSEYTIGTGGALTPMTPATVTTGPGPVSVTVDPTGKYAYVANVGNATVSEYTIGTGGALTPMTPATVTTGSGPVSVTTTKATQ